MGKGALAFIAGLGTGYLNQKNREEEKARQDKFDQIALDRGADEKLERERKKKITSELGTASQEGQIVEIEDKSFIPQQPIAASTGVQNSESQPQQVSQTSPIAAQGISPLKTETSGVQPRTLVPIASQGLSKSSWQMGGKSFSDAESANKAKQEYDTSESRDARAAQIHRNNGDYATALDLEAKSKQASLIDFQTKVEQRKYARSLQQEGVFDAAAALRRGDAASVKKAFNESGQHKIDGDVVVSPVDRDIPGVGKKTTYQATFNVIGPDGTPKQVSYNSHDLSMQLMPVEKALDWDHTIFKEKNRQDQWEQEFGQRKKTDAVNTGISAGHLKLSQDREKRQTIEGQLQEKERALGRKLSQEERNNMLGIDTMPQAIKMQAASLLKEQEQISQALNKAQADGTFVETDKDGKPNPLMVRSASLNMQLEKILNYKNKVNDPLGIMSANPQGTQIASQAGYQIKPQESAGTATSKTPTAPPPIKASEYKGVTDTDKLKQRVKTIGETIGAGIDYVKAKDREIAYERKLSEVRQRMADRLELNPEQEKIAIEAGLMVNDRPKSK